MTLDEQLKAAHTGVFGLGDLEIKYRLEVLEKAVAELREYLTKKLGEAE